MKSITETGCSILDIKQKENRQKGKLLKELFDSWELYLFILPALVILIIFQYGPIYGLQIAFRRFSYSTGLMEGEFIGLGNFKHFFNVMGSWDIIGNTMFLSIVRFVVETPIPIILAILLNQVYHNKFKKLIQTVTYIPYLISTMVVVGMIQVFLSPQSGVVNTIIQLFGGEPVNFMGKGEWVIPLYVLSDIWQSTGFGAVIYIAALANVDVQQIEAALVDGVNRIQKIWYIDLPSIMPTVVVLLILQVGTMMQIGFEKMLLMQNSLNIGSSEIISTYVYNVGIGQGNYNFATAVGIIDSIVNVALLLIANFTAKRSNQSSLF